jgi:hypothetical protein
LVKKQKKPTSETNTGVDKEKHQVENRVKI